MTGPIYNLDFPFSENLELALAIACYAHMGQKDKQNEPYILHVLEVIRGCNTEDGRIVAALHDVLEDTTFPLKDLERLFPQRIVEAVKLLTRLGGSQKYEDYILGLKNNPIAHEVKLSDLEHNMSRLDKTESAFRKRKIVQYGKALELLSNTRPLLYLNNDGSICKDTGEDIGCSH